MSLFMSMTTIHGTNSWDLDSHIYLYLNETDYFYLSLIPENHEVVVGVLGTGIETGLEYLDPYIYTNPNEIPNNAIDDDNNGVVDDVSGASFFYNDGLIISNEMKDASPRNIGHETLVASIIASKPTDENPTMFGPAYFSDSKIKLLPIRFMTVGLRNDLHTLAVNYAVSMNVDIMTCSYGEGVTQISNEVHDAYQRAFDNDIIVVSSAGNSGRLLDRYPCMYDDSICVGGIESDLNFSSNSSYAHNDFVAFDTDLNLLDKTGSRHLYKLVGTSYSAPQITATIAKILSFDDSYNKESVYTLLKKHAKFIGDNAGHGYIDYKSLVEEFVTIKTKFVSHPDNENLIYEFIWSEDKTSGAFARGFIRHVYLDGVRFSVFKEFQL